jgi:hypothetical protein
MHAPPVPAALASRSPAASRGDIPVAIVAGLALMGGAFALDVAAHATALAPVEPVAHAAGMLGMAFTWGAVVIDGLHRSARRA